MTPAAKIYALKIMASKHLAASLDFVACINNDGHILFREQFNSSISKSLSKFIAKASAELSTKLQIHTALTYLEELKDARVNEKKWIVLSPEQLQKEVPELFRFAKLRLEKHLELFSEAHEDLDIFESQRNNTNTPAWAWHYFNLDNPSVAKAHQEITRAKKILVHVCCGPDAAGVIRHFKRVNDSENLDCHYFWYDPNIQPKEEYDRRLEAFEKVAAIENVSYSVGEYDVERFYESIKGLEHTPEQGAKCSICYDMRLERAALEANVLDCDMYMTTLAISPHKVQMKLKHFGELSAKRHGVAYLAKNFMKEDGFKDSVTLSKEYNIYRQDYCGCYFSLYEGGKKARDMAARLQLNKEDLQDGYQNPYFEAQQH